MGSFEKTIPLYRVWGKLSKSDDFTGSMHPELEGAPQATIATQVNIPILYALSFPSPALHLSRGGLPHPS